MTRRVVVVWCYNSAGGVGPPFFFGILLFVNGRPHHLGRGEKKVPIVAPAAACFFFFDGAAAADAPRDDAPPFFRLLRAPLSMLKLLDPAIALPDVIWVIMMRERPSTPAKCCCAFEEAGRLDCGGWEAPRCVCEKPAPLGAKWHAPAPPPPAAAA